MTLGWNNPTTQPTMTVLLRHGDTRMSPEHRFSGLCDLPLSADGSRQARAAACRLAAGAQIDAVVTSPLRRAAATAAIAATELGLTAATDDDLRETDFGEWEGFTLAEIQKRWPEAVAAWQHNPSRHRRAVKASLTPPSGSTRLVTGSCETTTVRQCWW